MNSFEDILKRLRQGFSSGYSTLEGTFAGDILAAVASELARIYSQELGSVTERAFVQSAAGQWLDNACGDYGITRKPGESDESLRQRTLTLVRAQASSGNEAHYKAWAESLAGVRAAQARGLVRGPGTVDVYIIPQQSGAGQGLLDAVFDHIEALRPVCADVRVSYAEPMVVDMSAQLMLSGGASVASVKAQFEQAWAGYLQKTALSEQGRIVSLTRMAGMLMDCDGVLDVTGLRLAGESQSLSVPAGYYAVPGSCTLTQVVVA